jgi:basic membrane lipoprotein Med (substrate-binding protein (PBP1-ABC) superfamily)
MVKTASEGNFKGSQYDGKYRGTLSDNIVLSTGFGAGVPEDVKALVEEKKQAIIEGTLNPFSGPVLDQSGAVRIEEGINPTIDDLESTDYLIQGVIGSIPN